MSTTVCYHDPITVYYHLNETVRLQLQGLHNGSSVCLHLLPLQALGKKHEPITSACSMDDLYSVVGKPKLKSIDISYRERKIERVIDASMLCV